MNPVHNLKAAINLLPICTPSAILRGEIHACACSWSLLQVSWQKICRHLYSFSQSKPIKTVKNPNVKQDKSKGDLSRATNACSGSKGTHPLILKLALDGSKWLILVTIALPPGKNPATHSVGGYMGPNLGWTVLEKKKSLLLVRIRTMDRSARCQSLHRLSYVAQHMRIFLPFLILR